MIKVKIERELKNSVTKVIEPKFRDSNELFIEQLNNPDYALKQLEKLNNGRFSITCNECGGCKAIRKKMEKFTAI